MSYEMSTHLRTIQNFENSIGLFPCSDVGINPKGDRFSCRTHFALHPSTTHVGSWALAMLKQLAFGAELGQLAAEHSLCPSKDAGGDLGVFKPGDMAEEFDAFVFTETSPVGTPLGPFATPFGYHVVIIDEREL